MWRAFKKCCIRKLPELGSVVCCVLLGGWATRTNVIADALPAPPKSCLRNLLAAVFEKFGQLSRTFSLSQQQQQQSLVHLEHAGLVKVSVKSESVPKKHPTLLPSPSSLRGFGDPGIASVPQHLSCPCAAACRLLTQKRAKSACEVPKSAKITQIWKLCAIVMVETVHGIT